MPLSRRHLIAGSAALLAAPSLARARSADWQAVQAYSDSRRGVALLVLREGETLHESYSGGGGVDRAWELASGTKSFCGVLAAALVQDAVDLLLDVVELRPRRQAERRPEDDAKCDPLHRLE